MKKIIILFFLIVLIATSRSQNYQIRFEGTGASTTIDSVKIENLTQCTDTTISGSDTLQLTVIVGINEYYTYVNNALSIYPNPSTGYCLIGFDATAQGNACIELYETSGKMILHKRELLPKGYHTYSLSGIGSGVYFIRIESDKYFYTSKIVSCNSTAGTPEIEHIGVSQNTDAQITDLNIGKIWNFKSSRSLINMQYSSGDILKLTGKSNNYRTVVMLVPTQDTTVTFNFADCTDADSNHYAVVQIGNQLWMEENLNTSKYCSGDSIPNITSNASWETLTTAAYCDYLNTPAYSAVCGKLYNWYAVVDSLNLCPVGWHIPTNDEWMALTDSLGGEMVSGGMLKENCSTHWDSPNTGATNSTGFTALPGGYRYGAGATYGYIRKDGSWWSSTESGPDTAWYRNLYYNANYVSRNSNNKTFGFSVRCVKD